MKNYILAILGIVLLGVMIEIIIPNGKINKFIRSIYAIFVVAVFISPITTFFSNKTGYEFNYTGFELNDEFINYVLEERVQSNETGLEDLFKSNGLENIDIIFTYYLENYEIIYKSCIVNLKNLVILDNSQHINKYEFIRQAVKEKTGLGDAEIIFDE